MFKTPVLALTFSREGLSGASRNFHKWGRKYMLAHGDKVRDILLNSWEGVYFDINEQGMDQMMSDIASMGGELFVMDDGWFGDKYPRKTDNSSLGDWVVDRKELPNGVPGLVKAATKHGIKFGIWIEPEMTNSVSELYEQHPDLYEKAMSFEKDGYTWIQNESLADLIKPERIRQVKLDIIKRQELNKNKNKGTSLAELFGDEYVCANCFI